MGFWFEFWYEFWFEFWFEFWLLFGRVPGVAWRSLLCGGIVELSRDDVDDTVRDPKRLVKVL